MLFMLIVTTKAFMMSVVMLNVIVLCVIILSIFMVPLWKQDLRSRMFTWKYVMSV
jgi:hypothetical protein